jgi:hypothetical protein
MMKFSRAISQVKWLSSEKTNASKTISVLILEDEDRDGQPFDPADSLRKLHHVKWSQIHCIKMNTERKNCIK